MRVAIEHSLSAADVRSRLDAGRDEIASIIPGGLAQVDTDWVEDDRMAIFVRAMGQELTGHVAIEKEQVVFEIDLPGSLSFFKSSIANAIEDKGRKLLT